MVIKLSTLPTPPPLHSEIHTKCIQGYSEDLLPSLLQALFDSVTACGQLPLTPCTVAGMYVIASQIREIVRQRASVVGITPEDLETAVKHVWPEFLLDLEHQAAGADQRADRNKN